MIAVKSQFYRRHDRESRAESSMETRSGWRWLKGTRNYRRFMTGCLPMSLICRLEMTRHINFAVSLAIWPLSLLLNHILCAPRSRDDKRARNYAAFKSITCETVGERQEISLRPIIYERITKRNAAQRLNNSVYSSNVIAPITSPRYWWIFAISRTFCKITAFGILIKGTCQCAPSWCISATECMPCSHKIV